ncbi:hypothetical protein [Scytonema millei]|uniref:Uncharacterized protein n=1 Tax=Scytonema millei VB511283 TaxID=1245923 RepID=A0A9X5E1M0_9CYAN|nr:hypothetical protein [Scytonema millei]NHC33592.1 hypothetical protein [Scytonema millei VB511283]
MFKKRIGSDPHENGEMTGGAAGCPDIWELEDGSFAIIGARKTHELEPLLPKTASRGHDEEIVVIPRKTLIRAKSDIPNE